RAVALSAERLEAGRARARHDEARRARVEGRAQTPNRSGGQVCAARAALPLPAVRLLVDVRGQRADARRAVGEARADRRDRTRGLGLISWAARCPGRPRFVRQVTVIVRFNRPGCPSEVTV